MENTRETDISLDPCTLAFNATRLDQLYEDAISLVVGLQRLLLDLRGYRVDTGDAESYLAEIRDLFEAARDDAWRQYSDAEASS